MTAIPADARAALIRAGAAAWPELDVPEPELAAYLDACVLADDDVAAAHAADLYLACACSRGDPRALAAFEVAHGPELARIAARFARDDLRADDALQIVRERLFCAEPGAAPRIASYAGRGTLRGWACATAARALIDELRGRRPAHVLGADEVLARLPSPADDPELEYLKQKYRREFKTAFEAAVTGLDRGDRNLLRYHFVHGLTIDQLSTIYACHRATAARRLAAARDALLAATRRQLGKNLGVAAADVESILRLIDGQIEVSLHRLLASVAEPADQ